MNYRLTEWCNGSRTYDIYCFYSSDYIFVSDILRIRFMPYSILIIHIRNLLIIHIRNWDNAYSYMYPVAIHVRIRIQTYINMKYENKYDISDIRSYPICFHPYAGGWASVCRLYNICFYRPFYKHYISHLTIIWTLL